jgi:hypothetical protein
MKARLLFLFFLFFLPFFFFLNVPSYSQQPSPIGKKIAYQLPYPGIMPDNPLYFFKNIRDGVVEFFTRDLIKKSELYLHSSDKKMAMASALGKKGKNKLALNMADEAEKYSDRIVSLIKESKKQGANASGDLVLRLKLSNSKHQEIIEELERTLPQGEAELLKETMKLNQKIKNDISPF